MKTANVAEVARNLASLIDVVAAGEELVITRNGHPVVRMIREPASDPPAPAADDPWEALHQWVAAGRMRPAVTVAEMRERDEL